MRVYRHGGFAKRHVEHHIGCLCSLAPGNASGSASRVPGSTTPWCWSTGIWQVLRIRSAALLRNKADGVMCGDSSPGEAHV
jgi:hypothetical protein